MSKATQETEIEGTKIICHQLAPVPVGTMPGLYALAPRIVKIVAPLLTKLGSLGLKDLTDAKAIEALLKDPKGVDKLIPIITSLTEALGDPANANLPYELLCRVQVEETDADTGITKRRECTTVAQINQVFAGRFMFMLKCMWFSLGVNFSDFFSGAAPSAQTKE